MKFNVKIGSSQFEYQGFDGWTKEMQACFSEWVFAAQKVEGEKHEPVTQDEPA